MEWVYLSPHFDDVALSCGGLAWEQSHAADKVQIWTVCAGGPTAESVSPFATSLHTRWGTGERAAEQRRHEDSLACMRLGVSCRYFSLPDCIYRTGPGGEVLYPSEESLFGLLHPAEDPLVERLAADLASMLPEEVQVVCPLTLGGHVDHQLTRAAAERLGRPLLYYADYPYVLKTGETLDRLSQAGWEPVIFAVSREGLDAWQEAVAAHASQISSFWDSLASMRAALAAYWDQVQGVRLWKAPTHASIFVL